MEAEKWYRLAADSGDASAQYRLGVMYAFAADDISKDNVKSDKPVATKKAHKAKTAKKAAAKKNEMPKDTPSK